jgi:hypothetical protein
MFVRSLAIWLLLAGSLLSQDIGGLSTLPVLSEGRYPVRGLAVPTGSLDELSKWAQRLVVAANGPDGAESSIEVDIGLVKRQPVLYFSADKAGLYVLMLVDTSAKDTSVILSKRITVGEVVPPSPNPTPPGPPNPPPQPPTPPPITKGPRLIVLVREASQVTPAQARTELDLRSGPVAASLKAKGHTLLILSDDRGIPPALTDDQKFSVQLAIQSGKPRIVICVPGKSGVDSVLLNQEYTAATTAAQFLSLIEAHGG